MKKRFLVVGDNHLDSKTPMSRIDNYMEAGLMELTETLKIAKATQCDYYVMLGDVFNRMDIDGECRNRAIEILASDEGEPWPFEKYLLVGNHDVAHDPAKLPKSPLQSLVSAGLVKHVETIPGMVRFLDWSPTLDVDLNNGLLEQYDEKIIFTHASIVNMPAKFDHVLFDDLKFNPKTKLLFSGHIHQKMQAEKNGLRFYNPGSLGRPKISEHYENEKVSVLFFEFDFETEDFKAKAFQLRYSLPYDVIFDLDGNIKKKTENKNTEKFIETMTSVYIDSAFSSNITEDLMVFAEKTKINKKVIDMAIKTIDIIKTGGEL